MTAAVEVVRATLPALGASELVTDAEVGTVSVVGTGMASAPGYAAQMFRTLFDKGINIQLISTSDIRITCVVASAQVDDAVRALHDHVNPKTKRAYLTLYSVVPLEQLPHELALKAGFADSECIF
mgnify:CR=1 FL=1